MTKLIQTRRAFRGARFLAAGRAAALWAALASAAGTLLLAPPPALASPPAHEAYAAKSVHLRAGPGREYPVVAVLPQGTRLVVLGCLQDYSWCDVTSGALRGWVYAANVESFHEGSRKPLVDAGSALGIAIFSFMLGDYWGEHYHDRPWYRDRGNWSHRPPPRLAAPPALPPPPAEPMPHRRPGWMIMPPPRVQPPAPAPAPAPARPPRSEPGSPPAKPPPSPPANPPTNPPTHPPTHPPAPASHPRR